VNLTVSETSLPDNPRRYHAPGRTAQARRTRARILAAAHDLFVARGFAVTVDQVADAAGVSPATVELVFGTKAKLLGAVIDVALAGDDEPAPILERAWVRELDDLSTEDFLARAAQAFASGAGRLAPVLRALDEGSTRHPTLTALADRLARQRGVMVAWLVDQVVVRESLAADLTRETAEATALVLLDPAVHRRLLIDRAWSVQQLAAWLSRSLQRLLVVGSPE
jgi:TetR/AcrR family transcriptional regulator, regulator of autoinduction and epiphytic fitness